MSLINISSKSGSVSGANWGPAIQAAWTDIKAIGGHIYFDNQSTRIDTAVNFTPDSGFYIPLKLSGDHSSRLVCNTGSGAAMLSGGNLLNTVFADLIVIPFDNTQTHVDASTVLGGAYVEELTVRDCIFAGLRVGSAVIGTGTATGLTVKDSKFGGIAGPNAIYATGSNWIVVENCEFYDYQNFLNNYLSKTPAAVGSWIYAEYATGGVDNGASAPTVSIKNCRFDEGSGNGIYVKGHKRVQIEQCAVNVNGGGVGIRLENVAKAVIKQCNFGYTGNDVPAVKLINCGEVAIVDASRDHGPFRVEVDAASNANLKMIRSDSLTVAVV